MDMPVTLALAAAFAVLAGLSGWRGARPPDPARGVRMIPWRALMVLSAAGVMLMLIHIANMLKTHQGF